MKYDLWRFSSVLIFSFLVGLVTDHVALCVITGLILFVCWQYNEYLKILEWLKKRQESNGPAQSGLIDETCREIDFLRNRYRIRKLKLSTYLKRFQDATKALPDAIIILGAYGEIEWANNKAQEYLGVRWPQDGGLRIFNLVRNPRLTEYINSKSNEEFEKGLQLNSPTDADLKIEIRISYYGDTQKLLVARDVTSITRTTQMRKDFIANASHELRTPLTVISGYLESFADDEICPAEWLAHIRQMRMQTNRMQNLIEDLLELSSLEGNSENQDKDLVRVPDLLNTIVNEARSLSGFLEHRITLDADSDLYLKANQQQMHSAFSNLVFNAVQYTPEKGHIDVKWYEDADGAHLDVKDNGLGIDPEHIPRLTERFYRIDKGRSRSKGGTGLGLAIVKHVLAKHGGNIHIESKIGEGSLFRCNLPKSIVVRVENKQKELLKRVI